MAYDSIESGVMGEAADAAMKTKWSPGDGAGAASAVSHAGRSSRKNSRVTRSQINDFQSHASMSPVSASVGKFVEEEEMKGPKQRTRCAQHVCRHCNRSFSSGRALGGHIRIHGASSFIVSKADSTAAATATGNGHVPLIGTADSSNNSSSSLPRRRDAIGSDEEEAIAIEVDVPEFDRERELSNRPETQEKTRTKMVSLYSLRNNPRKSSRVMDPEFSVEHGPLAFASNNNKSSVESNLTCVSGANFVCCESGSEARPKSPLFGNWSVTRNRSLKNRRKRKFGHPSEANAMVGDDRDTANLLVMLSGKLNHGRRGARGEATEESVFAYGRPQYIPSIESEGSIKGFHGDYESHYYHDEGNDCGEDIRARKRTRMNNDYDEERGKNEHRCNTCNKVFTSHQALGGHRASHRKIKGCFAYAQNDEEEAEGSHSLMLAEEEEEQGTKLGHQCSICLKVFESGQALGGHKRCHWIADKAANSVVSSTEKQQQDSAGDRLSRQGDRLFDLNELPPVDTDMDGQLAYLVSANHQEPVSAQSANQRFRVLQSLSTFSK